MPRSAVSQGLLARTGNKNLPWGSGVICVCLIGLTRDFTSVGGTQARQTLLQRMVRFALPHCPGGAGVP